MTASQWTHRIKRQNGNVVCAGRGSTGFLVMAARNGDAGAQDFTKERPTMKGPNLRPPKKPSYVLEAIRRQYTAGKYVRKLLKRYGRRRDDG